MLQANQHVGNLGTTVDHLSDWRKRGRRSDAEDTTPAEPVTQTQENEQQLD
jgi:hypothetical protein